MSGGAGPGLARRRTGGVPEIGRTAVAMTDERIGLAAGRS